MTEQVENKAIETVENEQAKKKALWEKTFMESKKVNLADNKWATLCVAIPNPSDTQHDPFIDISLGCGNNNIIHIYASSYSAYRQFLENLAESCDYFMHEETFNKIIEDKLTECWAIREDIKNLPDDNEPVVDLSEYA